MKSYSGVIHVLLIFISFNLYSQERKPVINLPGGKSVGTKSEIKYMPCDGISNPPSLDLNILPVITYPKKNTIRHRGPDQELIDSLKAHNLRMKLVGNVSIVKNPSEKEDVQNSATPLIPEVGQRWDTHPFTGTAPADNTIAISNTGWVVTGANSSICYSRNGTLTYTQTMEAFLNYPGWSGYCDPVVLFDPVAKKFFMYIQHCSTSEDNYVALLFSKTANPNDGWYRYIFKGDQTGLGRFFDYPKIAVTNNEVFLTANLFGSDGKFSDSQIWQINKQSGYNGLNLNFVYWYNIDDDINFTLLPVSHGLSNTYGPGVYLVATESGSGEKIALYDITDDLNNNPQMKYYEFNVPHYEVGSDAFQRGTTCNLNVGDCRALSGFYLDGIIHFVHAAKRSDGWNGVHYFRLNVNNSSVTEDYFGLEDYDYVYPSIASYASTLTGKSAMIKFARTASDDYPETRVVHVDDDFNWSGSTYVKGLWEVECFNGNDVQRWGDYSGICRNYSVTYPSVMVAGAHGNFDGEWVSHAAEVHDAGPVANKDFTINNKQSLWPNPGQNLFSFKFQAPVTAVAHVQCTSEDGKMSKVLLTSTAQQGENTFSMNASGLVSGTYLVTIIQNNQIIANEKLVIQH
jgi:hypothetical protein